MEKGLDYLRTLADWRGDKNFDLKKIRAVLALLDNPQDRIPVVHIAGTNGKGSVSAGISAALAASGARVGMNISPHLHLINERIVIDGSSVSDDWLGSYASEVEEVALRQGLALSFHEAITAIAFHGFYRSGLEWAVMEVGLGGLMDASNVVAKPRATAIVSIDYDHQAILGPTLRDIARVKAGIIKSGVPHVTGPLPLGAEEEIDEIASKVDAPRFAFGKDYVVSESDSGFTYRSRKETTHFSPSLQGPHQGRNMGVVLALCEIIGISHKFGREGVMNVFWPGRLEVIRSGAKDYLLDCAHNPAGVRELVRHIRSHYGSIDIAFGALKTKAWREMVDLLIPVVNRWKILRPSTHLAEEPEEIVRYLSGLGISAHSEGDDYVAFLERTEREWDPLLITGSMYLVGQLRAQLKPGPIRIWSNPLNVETLFDDAV